MTISILIITIFFLPAKPFFYCKNCFFAEDLKWSVHKNYKEFFQSDCRNGTLRDPFGMKVDFFCVEMSFCGSKIGI